MAIYPTAWQAECDVCGDSAPGGGGSTAQSVIFVMLQQGWTLLEDPHQSFATLRCRMCAEMAAATSPTRYM